MLVGSYAIADMVVARRLLMGGGGSFTPPPAAYSMLYNGTDTNFNYNIGLATSDDFGSTWAKHASNPVLSQGAAGQWDDETVVDPSVFWDGSQWVMYYAGHPGGAGNFAIGRATSADLITWSKDGSNPVLSGGASFPGGVNFPTALLEGALTRLWYTGWSAADVVTLGYAEVSGGVLSGVGEVLGLGSPGDFDDEGLVMGPVVKVGSTYYVFYTGQQGTTNPDYRTGYATCTDPDDSGTYTKQGVIAAFSGTITLAGVTYRSNQLRTIIAMPDGTYRGYGSAFHSGDGTEVTFMSTSADLATWTTPTGPVLPLGSGGQWDSNSVENPSVVAD